MTCRVHLPKIPRKFSGETSADPESIDFEKMRLEIGQGLPENRLASPENLNEQTYTALTIIQIDITIIIRFSVNEMKPSGTLLPPPTHAQLRSRFWM